MSSKLKRRKTRREELQLPARQAGEAHDNDESEVSVRVSKAVDADRHESSKGLYEFLEKNKFIIDKKIADLMDAVIKNQKHKVFLLRGPAGVGKTQLTSLVAKYLPAKYVFYQCTYGSSEDDLLYKYIPSEETKSGIKITLGALPRALLMSRNEKVVLVLDEFDKTRPSTDALLLDVLQNFRVSLYIDDEETVIEGNPENLIIFLTSNDMREFSEPLMRRVVSVNLKPLPTGRVYDLLSERFRKETAMLLAQIYDDTVQAGLQKPATLQELIQLGEVLENGTELSLEELLKMFVIKYDDDWQKFVDYVSTRTPYQRQTSSQNDDVAKYYEPSEEGAGFGGFAEEPTAVGAGGERSSVQNLLERLKVRFEEVVATPTKLEEDVEVTLKAPDADFEAYSAVIKSMNPEPTDDPRRFGKFEFVEGEVNAIIAREPLSLSEAKKLADSLVNVEAYYEGEAVITEDKIREIVEKATKLKYYSNNLIYAVYESDDKGQEERIVLERVGDFVWRIKGYYKKKWGMPVLLNTIYDTAKEALKLLGAVLRKPMKNVVIRNILSNVDNKATYSMYDLTLEEIGTMLKNLRNSDVSVKVTADDYSYDVRLEKLDDQLNVYLGRKVDQVLKNVNINIRSGKININDPIIDKILKVLMNVDKKNSG